MGARVDLWSDDRGGGHWAHPAISHQGLSRGAVGGGRGGFGRTGRHYVDSAALHGYALGDRGSASRAWGSAGVSYGRADWELLTEVGLQKSDCRLPPPSWWSILQSETNKLKSFYGCVSSGCNCFS